MRTWVAIGALIVGMLAPLGAATPASAATTPATVSVAATAIAYNNQPATVRVTAKPVGRVVIDRLQIVVNGAAKASSSADLRAGSYRVAGRVTYRAYTLTGSTRHYGRSQVWTSGPHSVRVTHQVRYCGAPTNPYGYNFCGGATISAPAAGVCNYFSCIANFWNGKGYMVECKDSRYSLSGGRRGACSDHHGVWRPVYK